MTPRHGGYNVCTPVHIPGNAARTIICRKWNVSQGQKEAIIIGLYVWFCSMSVPMMEVIVEQIRDKDQKKKKKKKIKLVVFGTGVWGKRCLTLSNNTNPKGKYLASMPHKGAKGRRRAKRTMLGFINNHCGLETMQMQTKILDRLQS